MVTVDADGSLTTATCAVGPEGKTAKCSKPQRGSVSTPIRDSQDNPHEQIWVDFEGEVPNTMIVRIEHDGAVIFEGDVQLNYEPVDEACHGDCASAIENVELDRG